MSRERRLGRGLEALLGRTPNKTDSSNQAGQPAKPVQPVQKAIVQKEVPQPEVNPYGSALSSYETQPSSASSDKIQQPLATNIPPVTNLSNKPDESTIPMPETSVVDVQLIDRNPFQPRQTFDEKELGSLANSIVEHGLIQPIVVRRTGDCYQLVAGERRLRAAIQVGWAEVPVRVVEADDKQAAELAIIENLQRKDLNPLEKAISFQKYLEKYGATQEELAKRLGIDRSTVANMIRLLELPEPIQEVLRQGRITQGHGRALLPLGDEREQIEFCERIQKESLSVRQTEAFVQETIETADAEPLGLVGRDGKKTRARRPQSEHVAALEQEFRSALGTKIKVTHNARGRGKLVIHFRNHEEFERIRRHICHPDGERQVG